MKSSDLYISKANFVQLREGNIIDHYQFHPKELGRGAYGVVYRARDKSGNGPWRAVKKIIKKVVRNPNSIKNQIGNLTELDHPTIIKIYQIFDEEKYLYIVTDLCEGGQLFQKLQSMGSFTERDARNIFTQMLQALNYCHKQKICHRDLKPQNFLFLSKQDQNLKLIDFGLSFKWETSMRNQLVQKKDTKLVGTSYYIAPEIIEGSYDQRCDIWSAGVILYILVTAIPPFNGETDKDIIASVKRGDYTFEVPEMKNVSPQCKDLIKKMLMPQSYRLTIQQIFNHPWMKGDVPNIPLQLNFRRLSQFAKYSKLKKITANFIASKLSQKQVQKLGMLFKQMDKNNDGSISIQQLKAALDSQKQQKSYQQLKQIMDGVDTDKNGMINYTQFIASSIQASKMFTRQNLQGVFKIIDKDGNGMVDRKQLTQMLQKNNYQTLNGKQIDDIMNLCDKNQDGKIDFNQFVNSMTC